MFIVLAALAPLALLVGMLVTPNHHGSYDQLARIKKGRLLTSDEFEKLQSLGDYELGSLDYDSYVEAEVEKKEAAERETQRKNEAAERKSQQKKEQEIVASIPKLSVLVSAKIAQEVVAGFDVTRIVEVSNLLSPAQVEEGIRELHEELRPRYEEHLLAHVIGVTGFEFLEVKHLKNELAQCMAQGLNAVMQLEEVRPLIERKEINQSSGNPIAKGRSWKDIQHLD